MTSGHPLRCVFLIALAVVLWWPVCAVVWHAGEAAIGAGLSEAAAMHLIVGLGQPAPAAQTLAVAGSIPYLGPVQRQRRRQVVVGGQHVAVAPPLFLGGTIRQEDPPGFQAHELDQLGQCRGEDTVHIYGPVQSLGDSVKGGQVLKLVQRCTLPELANDLPGSSGDCKTSVSAGSVEPPGAHCGVLIIPCSPASAKF